MANPVIVSATLNKTGFASGEMMVLTVDGGDADEKSFEVTVVLRDMASGAESAPVTVPAVVDEVQAVATDTDGRVWTQTARAGSIFTLTAIA